jgi:hypothetical protein
MGRREFERRMRELGWRKAGVVVGGLFVKWTKAERTIHAPNHDILNRHTAFKLLGEAER